MDESVVYVGAFLHIWGHNITDNLRYLWFYFDERYAHLRDLNLVYTRFIPHLPPPHNFFEMLEMLGIPQSKLQCVEAPTQFKQVFVPDECFFYDLLGQQYTPEYPHIFDRLPWISPLEKADKIYLSRAKIKGLKDFNEMEVEKLFKKQGFKIVYPEKNSFKENLALLQNCTVFTATEGSIAHNLVFCRKVKTALILRKCRRFTGYQFAVNSLLEKSSALYWIDAGFSPIAEREKEWWAGPFFLYESQFLRAFFNLPPKKFPIFKYAVYYLIGDFWRRLLKLRAKLKIGTRLRNLKKRFFHGKRFIF